MPAQPIKINLKRGASALPRGLNLLLYRIAPGLITAWLSWSTYKPTRGKFLPADLKSIAKATVKELDALASRYQGIEIRFADAFTGLAPVDKAVDLYVDFVAPLRDGLRRARLIRSIGKKTLVDITILKK